MSFEFSMGTGDEDFSTSFEKWKAEKRAYHVSLIDYPALTADFANETDRMIALVEQMNYNEEDGGKPPAPRFQGSAQGYHPKVRKFLVHTDEFAKFSQEPPKKYVVGLAVIWETNREAKLTSATLEERPEIRPWVFNLKKYQALASKHKEYPLCNHDVKVTCTDNTYQSMDFDMRGNPLIKRLIVRALGSTVAKEKLGVTPKEDFEPSEQARELVEYIFKQARLARKDLLSHIGADLTLSQIREKVEGDGERSGGGSGSADVTSEEAGNVDDLLDDL